MTAACIAAHDDISGPFTKNFKLVSVPFDLRRHATTQVGDVFCLCVGAPRFSYTYDAKKPFWENVAVLHKEVHKRVEKLDSTGLEVLGFEPSFIDAFASFGPFLKLLLKRIPGPTTCHGLPGIRKMWRFRLHAIMKT
ncbi:MAG: hypothetical protein NHB15_11160 [Methanosarcina barkeri]|nr:hypothetical protein [Methanosarcina sp. ERenArc_MAG2]